MLTLKHFCVNDSFSPTMLPAEDKIPDLFMACRGRRGHQAGNVFRWVSLACPNSGGTDTIRNIWLCPPSSCRSFLRNERKYLDLLSKGTFQFLKSTFKGIWRQGLQVAHRGNTFPYLTLYVSAELVLSFIKFHSWWGWRCSEPPFDHAQEASQIEVHIYLGVLGHYCPDRWCYCLGVVMVQRRGPRPDRIHQRSNIDFW